MYAINNCIDLIEVQGLGAGRSIISIQLSLYRYEFGQYTNNTYFEKYQMQ